MVCPPAGRRSGWSYPCHELAACHALHHSQHKGGTHRRPFQGHLEVGEHEVHVHVWLVGWSTPRRVTEGLMDRCDDISTTISYTPAQSPLSHFLLWLCMAHLLHSASPRTPPRGRHPSRWRPHSWAPRRHHCRSAASQARRHSHRLIDGHGTHNS